MDDAGQCDPCPHGANCPQGTVLSTIDVKGGWYRFGSTDTALHECTNMHACVGGNLTGDLLCAEGYSGPLCRQCQRTPQPYYRNEGNGLCMTCEGNASLMSPGVIAIVVIFVLSLICTACLLFRRKDVLEYYSEHEEFLSTTLSQGTMLVGDLRALPPPPPAITATTVTTVTIVTTATVASTTSKTDQTRCLLYI